jgi:predicted regulator of Ras-like GTPase activity (Roadblock/LC7/MglB family)
MSAATLSHGERISSEMGRSNLDQVYIRSAHGYVIIRSVASQEVSTVLARYGAKLGLL